MPPTVKMYAIMCVRMRGNTHSNPTKARTPNNRTITIAQQSEPTPTYALANTTAGITGGRITSSARRSIGLLLPAVPCAHTYHSAFLLLRPGCCARRLPASKRAPHWRRNTPPTPAVGVRVLPLTVGGGPVTGGALRPTSAVAPFFFFDVLVTPLTLTTWPIGVIFTCEGCGGSSGSAKVRRGRWERRHSGRRRRRW